MYEMWADKAEPTVRLVISQGGTLPQNLGARDWLSLGIFEPSPETAAAIATHGFAFIHSDAPLPDPGESNNAHASGS